MGTSSQCKIRCAITVEVAKGEAPLTIVEPARAKPNHKPGFAPEWYEPGEEGFYVRRD